MKTPVQSGDELFDRMTRIDLQDELTGSIQSRVFVSNSLRTNWWQHESLESHPTDGTDLPDQVRLPTSTLQHIQGEVDVFTGVDRGYARTQAWGIHGDGWEANGNNEQTLGSADTSHLQGNLFVPGHDRDDGSDGPGGIKAHVL
jgi:hypothetical protein